MTLQTIPTTRAAETPLTDPDAERLAPYLHFLMNVAQFYETDKGKIASLKRASGDTLAEARGIAWLHRYLPGNDRDDEVYFLVATLFAGDRPAIERFHKAAKDRKRRQDEVLASLRSTAGSLGASLGRQRDKRSKESCDRRFRILLDCAAEELPYRLRQAVRLLIADSIPMDYPTLLRHLLHWDHSKRWVQKQWARDYFRLPAEAAPVPSDTTPDELA